MTTNQPTPSGQVQPILTGAADDPVGPIAARVAGRLLGRYVPLYAAFGVLLLVAAVLPSRVIPALERASAPAPVAPAPPSTSGSVASATPSSSAAASSPATPRTTTSTAGASTGPAAAPPSTPTGPAGGGTDQGGFTGEPGVPCPVNIGADPVISRGVAATLLGAASPVLSLLGPLSPNAVPALGVLSPILPILAPAADKFGPAIRPFNPLFIQISQQGTDLWAGPLNALEQPLLSLNASQIQPYEVELLASLAPSLDQINATPVTSCLERIVYNAIAPIPAPG